VTGYSHEVSPLTDDSETETRQNACVNVRFLDSS